MIVYAESNFVFELAFLREEVEHAEYLLSLSEAGRIRLVVPAFSCAEPYESLVRRAKRRRSIQEQLESEIEELARSRPYADLAETSHAVTRTLGASAEDERQRLGGVLRRLVGTADVIPLTGEVIAASLGFQSSLGLSPQDALVLASIDDHLNRSGEGAKVFVNKNSKDFLIPNILEHLARSECKLLPRFADARGYVDNALRQGG